MARPFRAGLPPLEPGERELFPRRLRRLRMALGIKQTEFADRINVSRNAVTDWENGLTSPRARDLPNIARALRVSTDYLLTGREAPAHAALIHAIQVGETREHLLAMVARHGV